MSTSTDAKPSRHIAGRKLYKPDKKQCVTSVSDYNNFKPRATDVEQLYSSPPEQLTTTIFFEDSTNYDNVNEKFYDKAIDEKYENLSTTNDLSTLCTENLVNSVTKEYESDLKKYFPMSFVC